MPSVALLLLALATPPAAPARSVTLQVPSISCGVCAAKVRETLTGKPGVAGIQVDMASRTVRVGLASNDAAVDSWVEAIRVAGYTATVAMDTATYRIEGASGRLERDRAVAALRRVPGVHSAGIVRRSSGERVEVLAEKGRVLDADLTAAARAAVAPRLRLIRAR